MANPTFCETNFIEIAGKRLFFRESGLTPGTGPNNIGIVFEIDDSSLIARILMRRGHQFKVIEEAKPIFGRELIRTWVQVEEGTVLLWLCPFASHLGVSANKFSESLFVLRCEGYQELSNPCARTGL